MARKPAALERRPETTGDIVSRLRGGEIGELYEFAVLVANSDDLEKIDARGEAQAIIGRIARSRPR